jgi:hypothetical protein
MRRAIYAIALDLAGASLTGRCYPRSASHYLLYAVFDVAGPLPAIAMAAAGWRIDRGKRAPQTSR